MKKISLVLAVIILATAMLTSCEESEVKVPNGMQLVTNDVVNYNLFVPDDWIPSISTGAVGAYCSAQDPTNVSVMAWNVDTTMTLDAWWEQYRTDFDMVFDEFSLIGQENVTLDEKAAQKYSYSAKLGEYEYYYVQYACIHYSMVYVITFTSTVENYESHLEDYEEIVSNFQFH